MDGSNVLRKINPNVWIHLGVLSDCTSRTLQARDGCRVEGCGFGSARCTLHLKAVISRSYVRPNLRQLTPPRIVRTNEVQTDRIG